MRSVLITGGAGFFGRHFAQHLLRTNAERICIYSRGEYAQAQMREEFGDDPRLRFFIGDVRDLGGLRRAMSGCDVVVHAAALKRIEVGHYNPDEMVKTNVGGATNVIEAAMAASVGRVVFLSTDKAYQPVSAYGLSKALAESLFLSANNMSGGGTRFAVTRYGNVWRSTGSVVPRWESMIAAGARAVPVTEPECTRFYMTTDQAVALVMQAITTMPDAPLIPDLPAYSIGDLATALGVEMEIRGLPDHEKRHESMGPAQCSAEARRMSIDELREALNHG